MCDPDLDPGSEKRTLVDSWGNIIMANILIIRLKVYFTCEVKKSKKLRFKRTILMLLQRLIRHFTNHWCPAK